MPDTIPQTIVRLRRAGVMPEAIAARVGWSLVKVRQCLALLLPARERQELGTLARQRPRTPDDPAEIERRKAEVRAERVAGKRMREGAHFRRRRGEAVEA